MFGELPEVLPDGDWFFWLGERSVAHAQSEMRHRNERYG